MDPFAPFCARPQANKTQHICMYHQKSHQSKKSGGQSSSILYTYTKDWRVQKNYELLRIVKFTLALCLFFIPRFFSCSIRAAPQAHVDVVPPSSAHRCVSNLNDLELPREPHMRCMRCARWILQSWTLENTNLIHNGGVPWHAGIFCILRPSNIDDFGISLHLSFMVRCLQFWMASYAWKFPLSPSLTHLDHPLCHPICAKEAVGNHKDSPMGLTRVSPSGTRWWVALYMFLQVPRVNEARGLGPAGCLK